MSNPNNEIDTIFADVLKTRVVMVMITIINIGFVCPPLVSASNWPAVIGGFTLAFANVWWIARRVLRVSP